VAVRTAYIDLAAIVECACGRLIVRRPPTNLLEEGAPVTLSFSPEHTVLLQG
jgi:hypothetical protein